MDLCCCANEGEAVGRRHKMAIHNRREQFIELLDAVDEVKLLTGSAIRVATLAPYF
jgi:hypothetical protein